MNALRHLFLLLGLGLLLFAGDALHDTVTFMRQAVSAQGTVVEIRQRQRGDATSYNALVRVEGPGGVSFVFSAGSGRKRQHFEVGESVPVLYTSGDGRRVMLDTPLRLWGQSAVLAAIGSPLFLIGAAYCIRSTARRFRKRRLQKHGDLLETCFLRVDRDQTTRKSGVHPYVIVCRWFDPDTSQVHDFKSEHIWFDPERFIGVTAIRVWRHTQKHHKYHVDVSFLPTMAG